MLGTLTVDQAAFIASTPDRAAPRPIDESERHAYNAAFYELGLRWHWDNATWQRLVAHSAQPAERVLHYLQTEQPHLLRAYEGAFLVRAIEDKKALHRRQCPNGASFDWSQAACGELGA
jgi:hypothetical protein